MQYGIKFVMYGENQAEAHNEFEEPHFIDGQVSLYIRYKSTGPLSWWFTTARLGQEGNGVRAFDNYLPINGQDWDDFGGEVHYMSYFINWSPQNNYYYVKKHCGFEQNPNGRVRGHIQKCRAWTIS